jgi:hypothetical protein
LINHLPSIHAGLGLLKGDNAFFHELALQISREIAEKGWSAWRIFSANTAATSNVALAAVVYYFGGANPALLIPINAIIQTLSAFILYKIVLSLAANRTAALWSALFFSVMPTTLVWISQLHKDGYAIFAWFLAFYMAIEHGKIKIMPKILLNLLAMIILYVTRPLYLNLLFIILALDCFYVILFNRNFNGKKLLLTNLLVCASFIFSFYYFKPVRNAYAASFDATQRGLIATQNGFEKAPPYHWQGNKSGIDLLFLQASSMRIFQMFFSGPAANSVVDMEVRLESKAEFFQYFPRALSIALLYPHPLMLIKIGNAQSYGLLLEILVYLILLASFLIYLVRFPINHQLNRIFLIALVGSTFLAYINPVIGSLQRVRYPFFALIMALGVISLFAHWQKINNCLSSKT